METADTDLHYNIHLITQLCAAMYDMSEINRITDIIFTNSMNRMIGMNERKIMNAMSIIIPIFLTYKYYSLHISQYSTAGKYE